MLFEILAAIVSVVGEGVTAPETEYVPNDVPHSKVFVVEVPLAFTVSCSVAYDVSIALAATVINTGRVVSVTTA